MRHLMITELVKFTRWRKMCRKCWLLTIFIVGRCFGQYVHTHIDPDSTNDTKGRQFAGMYFGLKDNLQGTVKTWDLHTGHVKKVKNFGMLPMPDRAVKLVNKGGIRYQKEKKTWQSSWIDWNGSSLGKWQVHASVGGACTCTSWIPANFPGIVLDEDNEDDPTLHALEETEETEEDQIRRVAQTTRVPVHGARTTKMQGTLDLDPTMIVVLPQNVE